MRKMPNYGCQPVLMLNSDGASSDEICSASTLETAAPRGPFRNSLSIVETAEVSPAIKAVTDPSASLRTQPVNPRRSAWSRAQRRKPTPCTLPVIRTNVACRSSVITLSIGLTPAGNCPVREHRTIATWSKPTGEKVAHVAQPYAIFGGGSAAVSAGRDAPDRLRARGSAR